MPSPLADLEAEYRTLDRRAVRHQRLHVWSRGAIMAIGVVTIAVQSLRMGFVEMFGPPNEHMYTLGAVRFNGMQALTTVASALSGLTAAITALSGVVDAPRVWVAARTGADALRAEAFLFVTGAGRYRGNRDDEMLRSRMLEIEGVVKELDGTETPGGGR